MTPDRHTLARLLRLERVRAIARQTAADEAARAEQALARSHALATRSSQLAAEYERRSDAVDGAELRRLALFARGLHTVCRHTRADADRAQAVADRCQAGLADAERRRAASEDRAAACRRALAARTCVPALTARRQDRDE